MVREMCIVADNKEFLARLACSREKLIHQKLQIENCAQFPFVPWSVVSKGEKENRFHKSRELKILCDMKIAFHLAFSVLKRFMIFAWLRRSSAIRCS